MAQVVEATEDGLVHACAAVIIGTKWVSIVEFLLGVRIGRTRGMYELKGSAPPGLGIVEWKEAFGHFFQSFNGWASVEMLSFGGFEV